MQKTSLDLLNVFGFTLYFSYKCLLSYMLLDIFKPYTNPMKELLLFYTEENRGSKKSVSYQKLLLGIRIQI